MLKLLSALTQRTNPYAHGSSCTTSTTWVLLPLSWWGHMDYDGCSEGSSSVWDQHNLLYQGGEINLGAVGYLRLFAVELLKFPLRHLSPVLTKLSWKTRCKEQAAGWQQCLFLSSTSSSPLPLRTSFLLTSQDSFWRQLLL